MKSKMTIWKTKYWYDMTAYISVICFYKQILESAEEKGKWISTPALHSKQPQEQDESKLTFPRVCVKPQGIMEGRKDMEQTHLWWSQCPSSRLLSHIHILHNYILLTVWTKIVLSLRLGKENRNLFKTKFVQLFGFIENKGFNLHMTSA